MVDLGMNKLSILEFVFWPKLLHKPFLLLVVCKNQNNSRSAMSEANVNSKVIQA